MSTIFKVIKKSTISIFLVMLSISVIAGAPANPPVVTAETGDNQITLKWDPAPGASGYFIYWSTSPDVSPKKFQRNLKAVKSPVLLYPMSNGIKYYFVVTAGNHKGWSGPSAVISATPNKNVSTTGFEGDFTPSTWISGSNAPVNLVNTSGAPSSVVLSNYSRWGVSGATFGHTAPENGTVTADYNFAFGAGAGPNNGNNSSLCPGTYWVGNNSTQFTVDAGPRVQTGKISFTVTQGQSFGFALNGNQNVDDFGCQSFSQANGTSLTISDFVFTPK